MKTGIISKIPIFRRKEMNFLQVLFKWLKGTSRLWKLRKVSLHRHFNGRFRRSYLEERKWWCCRCLRREELPNHLTVRELKFVIFTCWKEHEKTNASSKFATDYFMIFLFLISLCYKMSFLLGINYKHWKYRLWERFET